MPDMCNKIAFSTTCHDEKLDFTAENTSSSGEGIIELTLPEGTRIYDQHGELVCTIDGQPDKSKIVLPPMG